jgi:hypothetical protein
LTSFAGYLWFYNNGTLYRAKPETTLEVEPQPIRGTFRGMAVCDGVLVVCVSSVYNSQMFGWQPDPEGWFRLCGQLAAVGRYYTKPFTGSPVIGDGVIMTFVRDKETIIRIPVDNRYLSRNNPTNHGIAALTVTGSVALPIITPLDLAKHAKQPENKIGWVRPVRLGIEWGTIVMDSESFGEWSDLNAQVNLYKFMAQVSIDSGKTWSSLFSAYGQGQYFPQANEQHNGKCSFDVQGSAPTGLEFDIAPASKAGQINPIAPTSYHPFGWMFRVQHQGTFAPALRRVWLDYEVIPTQPNTGRTWTILLDLLNHPGNLQLDNIPDQQLPTYDAIQYSRLFFSWWQTGRLLDFYDLANKLYHVKVIGVEASRTAPGYRPTAAGGLKPEFTVKVTLAETFADPTLTDSGDGHE